MMANIQNRAKWNIIILLLTVALQAVFTCHPSSKELHICLNIYLERDFPLIETIVSGQQRRRGRGRVILEGPDLADICEDILELRHCYSKLFPECTTLWQLDRFTRLTSVLNATHHHLCGGGTDNVRDLLLNTDCMAQAKTTVSHCTGFNWWMSWRKVLRMQVSPADRCLALKSYRKCLPRQLAKVSCGKEAAPAYTSLIDVWLSSWCETKSSQSQQKQYFYYAKNANKYINERFVEKKIQN